VHEAVQGFDERPTSISTTPFVSIACVAMRDSARSNAKGRLVVCHLPPALAVHTIGPR